MKSGFKVGSVLAGVAFCTALNFNLANAAETLYVCDKGNPYVQVTVTPNKARVSLLIESETIDLPQKPSPDNSLRYEAALGGNLWQVFRQGDQISMRLNGNPKKNCIKDVAVAASTDQIVSELGNFSLGGIVRAGPGMNYKKIDSLAYGEPVALFARSGQIMNGYEWFKISYSEGQEGYQWGGIMCSKSLHIVGLYDPCPADLN